MCKISIVHWIANAAARFSGRHGAVTRQAQGRGCSRQTIYNHASEVQQAIRVEHSDRPSRERLLRENQELRRENGPLWGWLYQTIEFPQAKQQEFGVRAAAMGLSLNQIVELLTLLLGVPAAPGDPRSTAGFEPRPAQQARSSNASTSDARASFQRPVWTRFFSTVVPSSWVSNRRA